METSVLQQDAFSYTRSEEFTSESFKIEITNMPKYYGMVQFRKLLKNKFHIEPHKLKPIPRGGVSGGGCMFVTFQNEEKRQKAVEALNGYKWKNCTLSVRCASAAADPFHVNTGKQQKANSSVCESSANTTASCVEEPRPLDEQLRAATVPWWNVPYDEQLNRKNANIHAFLEQYKQTLSSINFPIFKWLSDENSCNHIKEDSIRSSPVIDKYRNKCEFTIGFHPESCARVVGFRLGSYRERSIGVVSPARLPHVPDSMQQAVSVVQRFVTSSQFEPYNPSTRVGHWQQLLVRCNRRGHTMLVVQFFSHNLAEEVVAAEIVRLTQFLADLSPDEGANIKSVYWSTKVKRMADSSSSGSVSSLKLVYGTKCLDEHLFDLSFQLSPEVFFQVNTEAAEVLYRIVHEMANVTTNCTLLDVCCGIGTIGLSIASFLRRQQTPTGTDTASSDLAAPADKTSSPSSTDDGCSSTPTCRVFGIESVPAAVTDAAANAAANSLAAYCRFYAGRAEQLLPKLLSDECGETVPLDGAEVVAVVDPPRAGLGRQVSQALRRCAALTRLVYVACDPDKALPNLIDLARPTSKQYRGLPFVVRRTAPVDMFPHTPNVELVLLLERCDAKKGSLMSEKDHGLEVGTLSETTKNIN